MRKVAPLFCTLMLLFSLLAQEQVASNSIGQDRSNFTDGGAYYLLADDSGSTLFHNDQAVWKESRITVNGLLEVSTFHYDTETMHLKRYESGRLVAEGQGDEMQYFYYDKGGLMTKSMRLVSGKLTEMELYTYDVGTHALNGILTITAEGSAITYFGSPKGQSWFSFAEGDRFTKVTQLTQDVQVQELWEGNTLIKDVHSEMLQDGGMRLRTITKEGEVSELYDDTGLLTARITPSLIVGYRYNEERALVEERQKSPDLQERIIRYEEGRAVSESLYQDGQLEKVTLYPKDKGKVETLYDKGEPYCDITYALDGKRVLSIRYR